MRTGLMAILFLALCGCEPYRIEYRRERPSFYARMSDTELPDRLELDDGTIVIYGDDADDSPQRTKQDDGFQLRYEDEDGKTRLRAMLPEHVVANTLGCLRSQEYQLLWDEMVAERTKMAYSQQELGYDEFADFCEDHRVELARMLNRMLLGFMHQEVVVSNTQHGTIECRFWPQVASEFRFKSVEISREEFQMKLVVIR